MSDYLRPSQPWPREGTERESKGASPSLDPHLAYLTKVQTLTKTGLLDRAANIFQMYLNTPESREWRADLEILRVRDSQVGRGATEPVCPEPTPALRDHLSKYDLHPL